MTKGKKNTKLRTVEEEIYKEVAETLELPISLVRDMVENGQSAYTASLMKSSNFESVRWRRFGCFEANPYKAMISSNVKGMNSIQTELFFKQISKGNILPKIPKWVIENGKLSDVQKKLLEKYGDAIITDK
jgi:hypothetical protein